MGVALDGLAVVVGLVVFELLGIDCDDDDDDDDSDAAEDPFGSDETTVDGNDSGGFWLFLLSAPPDCNDSPNAYT